MLSMGLAAAETDAAAEFLRSSQTLAFARLRMGKPGKLPRPTADLSEIPLALRREVEAALSFAAVGSPASVRARLVELTARYQPDEIMLTGNIHDHQARKESFRIAAEILQG